MLFWKMSLEICCRLIIMNIDDVISQIIMKNVC